jgi:hypothetical protein
METFIKIIKISALFSLSGITNYALATQWLEEDKLKGVLSISDAPPSDASDMQQWLEDAQNYFEAMERRYDTGQISLFDFCVSIIWLFKDQATDEKGLINILCERCARRGIAIDSVTLPLLFRYCLCDSRLGDTPIIVLTILGRENLLYDPCTNPLPALCRAVTAAGDIETMAQIFDNFDQMFTNTLDDCDLMWPDELTFTTHTFDDFDQMFTGDPEFMAQQSRLYAEARLFKIDARRGILNLKIGGKEVVIDRVTLSGITGEMVKTPDALRVFCNVLEREGLDEAQAFHICKQVVLAYRGQIGVGDWNTLVRVPLAFFSENTVFPVFDGVKIEMEFKEINDQFVLVEKTEYAPFLRVEDVTATLIGEVPDESHIIPNLRFKFPGDREFRRMLPIVSTRIPSTDGTIRWRCPFRENPPRKVIIYGGSSVIDNPKKRPGRKFTARPKTP